MRRRLVLGAALIVVAAAAAAALSAVAVYAPPAEAAGPIAATGSKVYVNGVDLLALSGIRGTTYSNVTVVFDGAGGVHLNIPGFAVAGPPGSVAMPKPAAPLPPPAPAAAAKKGAMSPDLASIPLKFYLVTEVPRPGFVQYDVEIWVNDAYIGMIKNEDGPLAVDVHAHVKPIGKNTLRFKATKRSDDRRSTSPSDYIKIILAEGRLLSGAVLPETRIFEYTKTAADVASATTEYMIEIKR